MAKNKVESGIQDIKRTNPLENKSEFVDTEFWQFSEDFLSLVYSEPSQNDFVKLLMMFVEESWETKIPLKQVKFLIFQDPEVLDSKNPMARFIFRNDPTFNISQMLDSFNENFREYLAANASTLRDFLAYRQIQKEFFFIFRRD